jgi:hypothetical protein
MEFPGKLDLRQLWNTPLYIKLERKTLFMKDLAERLNFMCSLKKKLMKVNGAEGRPGRAALIL